MASNLSRRPHGALPSNTKRNPRKEVNAITLRNGRELKEVEKEPREMVRKDKNVVDEPPKIDESRSSKPIP